MFASSRTVARFTCLEAFRNRLVWLMIVILAAAFGLTEFIGELAITETRQFQSGFLGMLLRFCAVFVVSLYVITSMVRELNDKGLELVLSLPVPRAAYFFGKLAGFSSVAVVIAALCTVILLPYVPWAQAALWGLSLILELLIVAAFSLFCLFTFNQPTPALSAVMGFYILSRGISALQLMADGPFQASGGFSQQAITFLVDALAFVLPELDRFTSSEWLIYHTGEWAALGPILGQTLIYLTLLCGAALFDLYRKNL